MLAKHIYIHSTSPGMSRVYIHLGVHEHPMSNNTCRASLDIAYQCIANELMKTSTVKNSAIVMVASKHFLVDYLFKSPSNGERHHLVCS